MHWDEDQKKLLATIAQAYREKKRDYTTTENRSGEELILTDVGDGRTDLKLGAGDYGMLVEAGYLRQQTVTFGGCTGTVSHTIMTWDAAAKPVAPQSMVFGGTGNAISVQIGSGNTFSGSIATGASVDAIAAARKDLVDAVAREIVDRDQQAQIIDLADGAVEEAQKTPPRPSRAMALFASAMTLLNKTTDSAMRLVRLAKLMGFDIGPDHHSSSHS